ncbi:PREDICTED: uncharacterized protein LOC105365539 [Ceratosolen solmsi marchali]|uniref:Uncharacterized protein LOC105365539 n=1 Tax=Ceratosolen solmsi marchali TaxID=326594 RepID=A0AAJ7DZE6_9HYME|nr:PREDICTED: uncharacterized protein LOC105365539 [Ceratosolen solmsi marchali]
MIMSDKSGVNLKVVSPLANLSANSAVILSGRCTSTPKDSTQLSMNDLKSDFDSIKENTQPYLSLNRMINFAPVPIFGRRNLQLLNNCINKDPSLQSPEAVKSLLQNENSLFTYLTETNVNDECVDIKKQYSEESSASITYQIRQEIKRNKNKNSSKKKRLSHYKAKVSVFKVSPRTPRAPRLLTAIRAEFKQNRQRLHKGNEKIGNTPKFPISSEKICQKERGNKDKNKLDIISKNNNKVSTHVIDTKNGNIIPSTESHKKEETEIHKSNKLKVLIGLVPL